ncbi:MAG: hypothetical protein WAV09_04020 [Minisyncoccia bacterium]
MIYCVSSSIANFKQGLTRKYPHWSYWRWPSTEHAVFFGMYHIGDVARLLVHPGKKTVVWCGSDIRNMQNNQFLLGMVQGCNAIHICENKVEQQALEMLDVVADVKPQLFDVVQAEPIYEYPFGAVRKQFYISAHEEREDEYGIRAFTNLATRFPECDFHVYGILGYEDGNNLFFHGKVSHEDFVSEIKNYHCAVRLNKFDGFSEVLARSAILGQYQISSIEYPHMWTAKDFTDLVVSVNVVSCATEPNYAGRDYWIKKLSETLI